MACTQVLLFCHSVKMLNIMEQLVLRAGYHYARLDGATRQQDRQQLVDEFNKSASLFLFLISTTAGGLGLNLTSANKCTLPPFLKQHTQICDIAHEVTWPGDMYDDKEASQIASDCVTYSTRAHCCSCPSFPPPLAAWASTSHLPTSKARPITPTGCLGSAG